MPNQSGGTGDSGNAAKTSVLQQLLTEQANTLSNERDREASGLEQPIHDIIQSHRIDIAGLAKIMRNLIGVLAQNGLLPDDGKTLIGEQGVQGEPGTVGEKGEKGNRGPPGPCCDLGGGATQHPPWHSEGGYGQWRSETIPTALPDPTVDPEYQGEPPGFTLPRWGDGSSTPTSAWPGRLHYLYAEEDIPRVYIADREDAGGGTFTSTFRVSTGRWSREPSAGVHSDGPTREKGVMFLNDTGNRVMFYRSASTISAINRQTVSFSGSGAISGAAALSYAGLAGADHRGYVAPYGALIKNITAQRVSGTNGGEILIVASTGSVETTLATVAFTTTAKTLNISSGGLGWLGITAGYIVYAKVPAGETERNITVTIETEDTE